MSRFRNLAHQFGYILGSATGAGGYHLYNKLSTNESSTNESSTRGISFSIKSNSIESKPDVKNQVPPVSNAENQVPSVPDVWPYLSEKEFQMEGQRYARNHFLTHPMPYTAWKNSKGKKVSHGMTPGHYGLFDVDTEGNVIFHANCGFPDNFVALGCSMGHDSPRALHPAGNLGIILAMLSVCASEAYARNSHGYLDTREEKVYTKSADGMLADAYLDIFWKVSNPKSDRYFLKLVDIAPFLDGFDAKKSTKIEFEIPDAIPVN